jgi:hypothetical protein
MSKFPRLSDSDNLRLTARHASLKSFNVAAVAMLRGEATIFEDHIMATVASARKTKILDGSERSLLSGFQSCLDDAIRLATLSDALGVLHDKHKTLDQTHNPADLLVMADKHADDIKGLSALITVYTTIQQSRGLIIQLRSKFKDQLYAPATLKPSAVKRAPAMREKAADALAMMEFMKNAAESNPQLKALLEEATAKYKPIPLTAPPVVAEPELLTLRAASGAA